MDNNNLFNQGNQNGEQGQPYQNTDGQYQQQPSFQNTDGQYQQQQQQQPYQNMDTQFQKQTAYGQYQQQPYGQQYQLQQPYATASDAEEPMSFADWMVTLLLLYIPCVNFIMLLVWAFGADTKKTKSNYAKASLVWMVIGTVVSTVIVMLYIGAVIAYIDSGMY